MDIIECIWTALWIPCPVIPQTIIWLMTHIFPLYQAANDVIEIMAIVNFGIAWGLPIIILTSLYSTGKIVYNCRKLYTETERSTGWQPWYSVETFKISFKVTRSIKGVNLTKFSFLCMETEQATGHYLDQDVLVTDAYMRHPSSISQPNKCPSRPYKGLNSSPPGQNGRHFADHIFKRVSLNKHIWILNKIPLINVLWGPIQIMAWRRPGDKPLSEPMLTKLTYICGTRGRWVKQLFLLVSDEWF